MLFYSAHVKSTTRALIDFCKEQKNNDANLGLKLYYICNVLQLEIFAKTEKQNSEEERNAG